MKVATIRRNRAPATSYRGAQLPVRIPTMPQTGDPPGVADDYEVQIGEVAEILGVGRSRADQISREPDFPKPHRRQRQGRSNSYVRYWLRTDVEKFAASDRWLHRWEGRKPPHNDDA
jgi:hypothetical protein